MRAHHSGRRTVRDGLGAAALKKRVGRATVSVRKVRKEVLPRRKNRGTATIVEVDQPPDTEGSKYPEPPKTPPAVEGGSWPATAVVGATPVDGGGMPVVMS